VLRKGSCSICPLLLMETPLVYLKFNCTGFFDAPQLWTAPGMI
jgi:hypothetical protein